MRCARPIRARNGRCESRVSDGAAVVRRRETSRSSRAARSASRYSAAMTTTLPAALRAPFSAGGASAIDAQLANRLLGLALEAGGDYADIYFEFRVSADYALEEEQVRTLGRGITLGLGVRVTKDDATGYAYCEDLAWEKMAHAARTAGQIAVGGGHPPVGVAPLAQVAMPSFYAVPTPSLVVSTLDKLTLLRTADRAARAFDPRIVKVEVSFAESIKEVLLFTSDGRLRKDKITM